MNWRHLQAFLWLRWRLLINQGRRAGNLNAVLTMILIVGAVVVAVPLGIGCFMLGLYAIPKAAPMHLLYAWDVVVVGFLFFWSLGLMTELQRTDPLSLVKFLHLPVSVNGAFLINYASSLLRLSLIVFVPIMLGFSLALIATKGALLLLILPSLAAFLLMMTALTYQFQGWLAALMSSPRRRRTVIVVATALFVLVLQLPNLLSFAMPWGAQRQADRSTKLVERLAELDRGLKAREFDIREYQRRQQEVLEQDQIAARQANRDLSRTLEQTVRLSNLVLPVGWLPLGAMAAAEGRILPAVLGTLGMLLIGIASLWRAYRTTIQLYQGQFTTRKKGAPAAAALPVSARKPGLLLLELRIPGTSEPVSAIALGSLRSLLRSPEAKMMLLTPILLSTIFGSMLLQGGRNIPDSMRPMIAIGVLFLVLFGLAQLMANQFGFDRDGFRVFVLCAAPRRDILLGKNLAFAPLAFGLAAIMLSVAQVVSPLRMDHFLAMLPQFVSMFLLFCILTNLLSIYAPMHIAAGSLKPSHPKLLLILLQMVMLIVLFPLIQAPTLLPLGIETAVNFLGWIKGAPIYLVLSLAECAAVIFIYRYSLDWQGNLFQAREQRILESVTNRGP